MDRVGDMKVRNETGANVIPLGESEYELTWRATKGSNRRYQCKDEVNVLDGAGRSVHRERRTAEVSADVFDLSSDGAPIFRWTYTGFTFEVEQHRFDDLDPPAAAALYEAPSRDQALPANPIVLESNPEAPGSFYIDLAGMGLAKSLATAMTGELIVHTRAFWQIATRRHGGIDRLRKLGDSTRMPWSGTTDRVRAGEVFDVSLHRGEDTMRFDGLTIRHGREAALLTFRIPYDPSAPGWGPCHTEAMGQTWIDLASGELLAAARTSFNYATRIPQPNATTLSVYHRWETSLELISD